MAEHLLVVAETAGQFGRWCAGRALSTRDSRLAWVHAANYLQRLSGTCGASYVLVWWEPARIDRRWPIDSMLTSRDAIQLIGAEIDDWFSGHGLRRR